MSERRLPHGRLLNMASLLPPPEFIAEVRPRETWWFRVGYEALFSSSVHPVAALQRHPLPEETAPHFLTPLRWGRGHVWRIQLASQETAIIRPYRRGGFVRHFVKDLYWDRPPRPLAEVVATETARQRGVPTIEVLGACVRWSRSGLYRGVLISREAEGFQNLWEWLQQRPSGSLRTETLTAVAQAIMRMHEGGIVHADLNLTNILVSPHLLSPRVLLLDFDRAQILSTVVPPPDRKRTFQRLYRSLRKLNPDGALYSADDIALLGGEPSP